MKVLYFTPYLGLAHGLGHSRLFTRQSTSILDVPQEALNTLRDSVSGRLYPGTPQSLPCFSAYNSGRSTTQSSIDAKECSTIRNNAGNGSYISNNFGGYMTANWGTCSAADRGCAMPQDGAVGVSSGNKTCHQGSVPNWYIDVREVEDIQRGVEWAAEYKVPLVVKNTGHDYAGRSSGANSLGLWTHNYRPALGFHEDFVPEGCYEPAWEAAVSVGAGYQFSEVHTFVHDYGYSVVSGASGTVGAAGGWVLGGGHSPYSAKLGLSVDNVLQMSAVLPNGTLVTANRCQNQNLFYALRGGGGSAFGVLTEVVYKLHQEFPVHGLRISFDFESKEDTISMLVENAEQWSLNGMGVYFDVNDTTVFADGTIPYMSREEVEDVLQPLFDFANDQQNVNIELVTFDNHLAFMKSSISLSRASTAIGDSFVVSSRLIPRENFEEGENRDALIAALAVEGFTTTIFTIGPANFEVPESDQPGGPGESSVPPVWRDTIWFVLNRAAWDSGIAADTRPERIVENIKLTNNAVNGLRDLTPGGSTYMNEANPYEPNEQTSFWGQENYDRLLKIKREIDPENVLSCWQCIGFDRLDSRFGCYPQI